MKPIQVISFLLNILSSWQTITDRSRMFCFKNQCVWGGFVSTCILLVMFMMYFWSILGTYWKVVGLEVLLTKVLKQFLFWSLITTLLFLYYEWAVVFGLWRRQQCLLRFSIHVKFLFVYALQEIINILFLYKLKFTVV